MVRINEDKTYRNDQSNMARLIVAVDGDTREEIEGLAARQLATKHAGLQGVGGGLCNLPIIMPVGEDGDPLPDDKCFDQTASVLCYRALYEFAGRIG